MKNIVKIIFCIIYLSPLISKDIGYYIYKFSIDKNDSIIFQKAKFVNSKLKPLTLKNSMGSSIVFKIKDGSDKTLYEGEIQDPRSIHHEDFKSSVPLRYDFTLEQASFIIKSPNFGNQEKIEFYKFDQSSNQNKSIYKLLEMELKFD